MISGLLISRSKLHHWSMNKGRATSASALISMRSSISDDTQRLKPRLFSTSGASCSQQRRIHPSAGLKTHNNQSWHWLSEHTLFSLTDSQSCRDMPGPDAVIHTLMTLWAGVVARAKGQRPPCERMRPAAVNHSNHLFTYLPAHRRW